MFASQRFDDYMVVRRQLEAQARALFLAKGGSPANAYPHYMTLGPCEWIKAWYENAEVLQIPLDEFDPASISFTYGDLFPTMRYQDEKPYRKNVYSITEIFKLIDEYGWPQVWNRDGDHGPERYIEVQVWDDAVIRRFF
ncbi:hypothetical protein [Paenibacillus sp. JCM 10914]|uniref:hypothetical protein n=1 Tax=Paenibacillus sp. JCM 10914 TaxID=1236974 RepID=UPI000A68702F|nr:hypothetical protein [Paenibacillus sp. JCM 10914]